MNLFGPVFGTALEAVDLTAGNVGKVARGQDTHVGAEAVRFVKYNSPFINLWYLKSAVDHAVLQDIQDYLSPGYRRRIRMSVKREWGQDYWWRSDDKLPRRAPDFTPAFGLR